MADYSFSRRPVWIAGHLVVLLAVATFVNFGFWQLRRHDERSVINARIEANIDAPALTAVELTAGDPVAIEWRTVELEGTFRVADEVVLRSQSLRGVSGHHVLTPLVVDGLDGVAVVVDRGWVPIDLAEPGDPAAAPPGGVVTVSGVVRRTQTRGSVGPVDPPDGRLEQIARVDLARIDQQVPYDLARVYVVLQSSDPAPGELPVVLPRPDPDGGPPHLAYAGQWFLFAVVVAVGYPILLRRTAASAATDPSG